MSVFDFIGLTVHFYLYWYLMVLPLQLEFMSKIALLVSSLSAKQPYML